MSVRGLARALSAMGALALLATGACDSWEAPKVASESTDVPAETPNDQGDPSDTTTPPSDTHAPTTANATDTSVAPDTATHATNAPDTVAGTTAPPDTAPDTTVAPDTTEPEPDPSDLTAPGPLPDMGLPPLGYLGSPPFGATGTTCGTGSWWWGYTIKSPNMQPGAACIDCHTRDGGPHFRFAGTVMSDYNDNDQCRGIPTVDVDIIDANGQVALTMQTNGAGNFYSDTGASIAMPYTARIRLSGREREMTTPTDRGDCNACHTSVGLEDAPGRIVLP